MSKGERLNELREIERERGRLSCRINDVHIKPLQAIQNEKPGELVRRKKFSIDRPAFSKLFSFFLKC